MFRGADPGRGWRMTDPLLQGTPTLGACMPNIRRAVVPGDYVFVVSGRVPEVQQFVVGGFRVADKIDALAAYQRFPGNRLHTGLDGQVLGNIIVDSMGQHDSRDYHAEFERRIRNYVVGEDPIALETAGEIEQGRRETVDVLGHLFGRTGERVQDVIGRWRRLDEFQIQELVGWLSAIKEHAA